MASLTSRRPLTGAAPEAPGLLQEQPIWARMHQIDRRQWWLWVSAIVVTLLLTAGIFSFTISYLFTEADPFSAFNLRQYVRGLIGMVLLFDVYAIYQQLQIYRIRGQLNKNIELCYLIGQNAADLIAVVDTTGQRLYNSPAYEKVLGYSAQELRTTPALEQVHPDDRQRLIEAAEQARQSGVSARQEYRFRHKNGTWRILESTASAVRDARGETERLVIINRDITERKQAEADLQQREEQLRQAQKMEAVGRLSGGIAHDFNNLLGVIIGYSEVLETRLSPSDPLRKSAGEIKKAGQRAASLTRQLLAFSRQQVLQPRILELNVVVADIGNMLRRLIGADIELTTLLDPSLGRVKVDQGQMEQAIMNLTVNARDAMPDGGKLTIETTNAELDESIAHRFPYVQSGRYVLLTVGDTGIGMDEKTQSHIFEPFFTTKDKGKGTGLGLATVYGVVKQSGGYIWVNSAPGQGATFKIYLPLVEEAAPAARQDASPANFSRGSETVLLVEDEDSLRTLTSDQLLQSGYKVLSAPNGARALEIAQEYGGSIHLLLSDVVMPGMSGQVLAKNMAASRPEMRVLYISGYLDRGFGPQANLQPGTLFLQKPFTHYTLIHTVRQALEQKEVPSCD